jgi:tRNA(fMet)-specific endonuclease VapC
MPGDYLLDTNIVIALFNGEESVSERVEHNIIFLSTVVIGELYFGALTSSKSEQNVARLERFAGDVHVLAVSRATSHRYGMIKSQLKAIGKPIPENDIWIAATTIEHDLTLCTRDEHFRYVSGLQLERW